MDSNSLIIFILLFIVIGMLSYLYSENQKKANEAKNNTDVEVVEYNPYIYYNPYYYDGYPWWWYGSGGYGDRRFYYGGHGDRRIYHGGHGFRRHH